LREIGRTVELGGRACFVIPHAYQVDGYAKHATPWINAMVQGWAGAVFARAYQLTGEDRFAQAARRTAGPCFVPVAHGGVRDIERNGYAFYEKYPFSGQTRHVLHGFLASLLLRARAAVGVEASGLTTIRRKFSHIRAIHVVCV
jgi:hypothetical protein